ncbi:MAG TPA: MipA/OmpV family protein [Parasulfuritortus sp.]
MLHLDETAIHMMPTSKQLIAGFATTIIMHGAAIAETPARLDGDLGAATYVTQGILRGQQTQHLFLPFAYLDYGRFYARVDTFGAKLLPVAYGQIEVAGRVSFEGYQAGDTNIRGISDRSNPVPIGIGSFQETPVGALFLYAFHDVTSSGSLFEATYMAELDAGRWTFYPELGIERRSAQYVNHLYGVSLTEASSSGIAAYSPNAAVDQIVGLAGEIEVRGPWRVNWQWQYRRLGESIRNSPLVTTKFQNTGFIALTYHFGQQ